METANSKQQFVKNIFKKYMMEIILIIMFIGLSVFATGFLTSNNILNIFRSMAIVGVIAFGMTLVIVNGEIDLSVGSTIALSAVVTAIVASKLTAAGLSATAATILAIITSLVMGGVIGLFNGFIRAQFKIPTFIITLAMLNVLYGIAATLSKGFPVTIKAPWYSQIGAGTILSFGDFRGIPVPAIWLIIVFAIIWVVMSKTRFGREIYAVGGNPEAARLSGINIKKVKIVIMVVVQVLAAFAGIILSSQVMAGSPQFGKGYEMDVIAAVIIGGTSLFGGVGKAWGTFIGIIFLGVIINGMTLLGVDDYVKYIVRGSLILIAVLINTIQLSRKDD
jgi:ribose/xylose/arabinose/galactoside ABC-type transport system permease subunit